MGAAPVGCISGIDLADGVKYFKDRRITAGATVTAHAGHAPNEFKLTSPIINHVSKK